MKFLSFAMTVVRPPVRIIRMIKNNKVCSGQYHRLETVNCFKTELRTRLHNSISDFQFGKIWNKLKKKLLLTCDNLTFFEWTKVTTIYAKMVSKWYILVAYSTLHCMGYFSSFLWPYLGCVHLIRLCTSQHWSPTPGEILRRYYWN